MSVPTPALILSLSTSPLDPQHQPPTSAPVSFPRVGPSTPPRTRGPAAPVAPSRTRPPTYRGTTERDRRMDITRNLAAESYLDSRAERMSTYAGPRRRAHEYTIQVATGYAASHSHIITVGVHGTQSVSAISRHGGLEAAIYAGMNAAAPYPIPTASYDDREVRDALVHSHDLDPRAHFPRTHGCELVQSLSASGSTRGGPRTSLIPRSVGEPPIGQVFDKKTNGPV